jgi:hypothetical protein
MRKIKLFYKPKGETMKTINTPDFQAAFVNTQQIPISRVFICNYVTRDGEEFTLHSISEDTYKHPDTDDMVVKVIMDSVICTHHQSSSKASPLIVLFHAQESLNAVKSKL